MIKNAKITTIQISIMLKIPSFDFHPNIFRNEIRGASVNAIAMHKRKSIIA